MELGLCISVGFAGRTIWIADAPWRLRNWASTCVLQGQYSNREVPLSLLISPTCPGTALQWSATQLMNWQMFIIWPLPVGPEIILPCGSNTRVNSPTSNRSPNDGSAATLRPVTITMVLPF